MTTTAIAIYAAALATLSLVWQIVARWQDLRPKITLKLAALDEVKLPGDTRSRRQQRGPVWLLWVSNEGAREAIVSNLGVKLSNGSVYWLLDVKTLPCTLAPGQFTCLHLAQNGVFRGHTDSGPGLRIDSVEVQGDQIEQLIVRTHDGVVFATAVDERFAQQSIAADGAKRWG